MGVGRKGFFFGQSPFGTTFWCVFNNNLVLSRFGAFEPILYELLKFSIGFCHRERDSGCITSGDFVPFFDEGLRVGRENRKRK